MIANASPGWERVKLGELIAIKHGFAFKGEHFSSNGPFVLVTPGNFAVSGGFKHREPGREKYYAAAPPQEFVLKEGDLILALTDLTQDATILGCPAIVPSSERYLHNQRIGRVIILDENAVDLGFLYFLFCADSTRAQIRATATGATVRHTAPKRIYDIEVPLPPLSTQRAIAGVLSAYDRLIGINTRRVDLLEEISKATFREWFVRRRSSGESLELRGSRAGEVPQEWRPIRLGDRFQVVLGGTPSRQRPEFWVDGSISWVNSGEVNNLRVIEPTELITEEAVKNSSTKLMPAKTTLIAITGATLGEVSYLEIPSCANQSVVGVYDPEQRCSELIYLAVLDQIQGIVAKASGGAQQHINKAVVEETILLLPPDEVLLAFRDLVRPSFDLMAVLLRSIRLLRTVRDLLLPRLVSGRVAVPHIDDETGLVA
jgi:type I restriction enzyme S subunit